jgi:hypothetical protein
MARVVVWVPPARDQFLQYRVGRGAAPLELVDEDGDRRVEGVIRSVPF